MKIYWERGAELSVRNGAVRQSWREFCPGLMAVGRGKTQGPTTRLQSVSEREARQIPGDPCRPPQIPTDAYKFRQVPTDPHRCLQAQTEPHSSPLFKQRICSPPQSLIVFRSGREENNHSVIVTHSRRKDRRWKNRNLGHYALIRLYLQTGVVISRLKAAWGRVFPKAVSSRSQPCSSAASMRPSLPIRYVSGRC